ncbi:hypothetical protein BU649_05255, partial [Staphylococcus chromogenes]|uniref:hypothetical protein n=1 Tax=Staphylococcus chromogenes TaxID=46126 RepID=UPI000D1A4FF3
MNNEELASKLLLIKQSIDVLQEELAPHLKTKDLVLLRYNYHVYVSLMLNDYSFILTMYIYYFSEKEFKSTLFDTSAFPEFSDQHVLEFFEAYLSITL